MRGEPHRLRKREFGERALVAVLFGFCVVLGCTQTPSVRVLTLVASFPSEAVSVCFQRHPDNQELGCTSARITPNADGTFEDLGRERHIQGKWIPEAVAVVHAAVPKSPDVFRVRAIAYNSAGSSLPSSDYLLITPDGTDIPPIVRTAVAEKESE